MRTIRLPGFYAHATRLEDAMIRTIAPRLRETDTPPMIDPIPERLPVTVTRPDYRLVYSV